MITECLTQMTRPVQQQWISFLQRMELEPDFGVESTVLIWDDEAIIAAGSRQKNVLKCIAVDPYHQGEGLTATLLTQLRQDAFSAGYNHLFLYTKPQNEFMFSSLFFFPVVKTDKVLLMENVRCGITSFLSQLEVPHKDGKIGSIVMHCNPFTKGHRYLIETAAKQCDWLYIFVLSEEQSIFPAADRIELVRKETEDLKNVSIHPTGQYLISSATFPSYFIKDKGLVDDAHCRLDISVFAKYFVPHFGITHRFVGTEPNCVVTGHYNEALKKYLPEYGVTVTEIPRLKQNGMPISASSVRSMLHQGKAEQLQALVPGATFDYLQSHNMI